jgi:DNA repair protein RadA/Sms
MAKGKTLYICQSCGYATPKWLGKCPDCGQWNSFLAERQGPAGSKRAREGKPAVPVPITQVEDGDQRRLATGIGEFDRILGGGVVPGSLVLVGGDPGIGKSTLLLQVAHRLGQDHGAALYVSGEESAAQTKQRAERLGILSSKLMIFTEVDLERILGCIHSERPRVVIVDSIQTVYDPEFGGTPGSVGQIRDCTDRFLRLAKSQNVAFFLIGHVTKSGAIAGPRLLEHMVDTVLYFEGDRHHAFRILRAVKNRFGPTNEIGVFEMGSRGLAEVSNPSKIFLAQRGERVAGSVVVGALEGTRPLLVEIQALVSRSNYSMPQRVVTGVEYQRLVMLLAVLEKKHGMRLGTQDVFVNAAGGIRVEEPAADLGIVTAIVSSYRDRPADPEAVIIGEIGLAGEVRAISHPETRIKEAQKLGFRRCIISQGNLSSVTKAGSLEVVGVKTVREALHRLLEAK